MPVQRKMPHCEVATVFILGFLVLTGAMPAEDGGSNEGSIFGLPFLQFKNGGIRVNFGGYHAEAGLGGLLGGSRAGGGLHASAGTPWGANAAAGLGGDLGGADGTAGGGLYARAGLGNGRPEAAAGLGGRLDGSGRSNGPAATGGLYAGATTGGLGGDDVSASSGASASASGGDSPRPGGSVGGGGGGGGRSSIQVVSRGEKKKEHAQRAVAQQNVAPSRQVSEEIVVPGPSAQAGLFGSVFANPASGGVVTSVDKFKVIDQGHLVPSAPPLPNEVNAVIDDNRPTVVYQKHVPRWYLRKRFWAAHPRKQVIYVPTSEVDVNPEALASSSASASASASAGGGRRLYARASGDAPEEVSTVEPTPPPQEKSNTGDTFFDDIFRIPMASIGAVNQMLNNAG